MFRGVDEMEISNEVFGERSHTPGPLPEEGAPAILPFAALHPSLTTPAGFARSGLCAKLSPQSPSLNKTNLSRAPTSRHLAEPVGARLSIQPASRPSRSVSYTSRPPSPGRTTPNRAGRSWQNRSERCPKASRRWCRRRLSRVLYRPGAL